MERLEGVREFARSVPGLQLPGSPHDTGFAAARDIGATSVDSVLNWMTLIAVLKGRLEGGRGEQLF